MDDLLTQVPALNDTIEALLTFVVGGWGAKKVVLYWRYVGAPLANALLKKELFKTAEERRMSRQDFERLLKESEERIVNAIGGNRG